MYAELKMELDNQTLDFKQASNLQGVIMENMQKYCTRVI